MRGLRPSDFGEDGGANFRRGLIRWYRREGRDLPWRRTSDAYAVLVSEFMLQQTQVATVLPYYERWLKRFPDFATLARAEESEVLHAWQGLGYYSRARHIHAAAKMVQQCHGGKLPADAARIAKLPGVGRYTAGAIASFGFDQPEPIVDANIARVLARLTNWRKPIDCAAGQAHLWRTATALVPAVGARSFNSALMDLGATICLPRAPLCGRCPVRRFCQAKDPAILPVKRKKPATIRLTECHAFSQERGRLLLEQSSERWRGMWILPRLDTPPVRPALLRLDFPFTHHRITLAVFDRATATTIGDRQKWFPVPALGQLPVPSPHRRALAQLLPNDYRLS
ncbi:MAG: A/G-specific adenine glycosylase [Chthoniobacterales bacterium]